MAVAGLILNNRRQQAARRSTTRQSPKKKSSSNTPDCPHGRRCCRRCQDLLSRHQDASPSNMFSPSRPETSIHHILHRRPGFSSLSRRQRPAEGEGSHWAVQGQQAKRSPGPASSEENFKDARRTSSVSIPTAYAHEVGVSQGARHMLDRHAVTAAINTLKSAISDRTSQLDDIRDTVTEVLNDVPEPIEISSSDGRKVAKHWTDPQTTPHHWQCLGKATSATRHSLEWETETLLDQTNGSSVMDMHLYPCPFRKRNPARFNIRDYEACARAPFNSIHEIKHHIVTHHRRRTPKYQCRRCRESFETEVALEDHLLLPRDQMCEVKAIPLADPEEGITEAITSTLVARDAAQDAWTWEGVWRIIFPGDPEVPEPDFQPVTELVEVEHAFDEGQEALKESLREKLKLLVPGAIDNDYLSFLTGQVELVFETHRINVMKQSSSRSVTATVQEPPGAQMSEQQMLFKRSNRKSRRSTLLHTPQRNAHEPMIGHTSRRASRISNSKHTNRLSSEPFRLRNTEADSTNNISERPTPEPDRPQHTLSDSPKLTDYNTNPRDSRDSGIGLLCDACHTPEDECTCSEPINTKTKTGDDQKREQHQQEQRNASSPGRPQLDGQTSQPSPLPHRQPQQHQPRLSIDTNTKTNTNVTNTHPQSAPLAHQRSSMMTEHPDGPVSATVALSASNNGGRFSPESFKQRVLTLRQGHGHGQGLAAGV